MVVKRIAISGSRSIKDKSAVWEILNKTFPKDSILVHGGARGVDTMAKEWAIANGVVQEEYRPNWRGVGHPGAGMIRNTYLIEISQGLIAIWDGTSKGTLDAMKKAQEKKIPVQRHLIPSKLVPSISKFMAPRQGP